MSSELLMDAKLIFPSQEAITQFLQSTNVKHIFVDEHSVEGIFSENVINTACSVFKAALTVMPYYLSSTQVPTFADNNVSIAE